MKDSAYAARAGDPSEATSPSKYPDCDMAGEHIGETTERTAVRGRIDFDHRDERQKLGKHSVRHEDAKGAETVLPGPIR